MNKRLNRRQLLQRGAAFPLAISELAHGTTTPSWAFLGTDKGQGIYRTRWNPATGEFGPPELAIATTHPSFLCLHPHAPVLFCTNEVGKGNGALSSFRLDAAQGTLTRVTSLSSAGDAPCFVSMDRSGKVVFVANYSGGSFSAYMADADGTMMPGGAFNCTHDAACGTLGPVAARQDNAHLHSATLDPGNQFVVVCDLGKDSLELVHFEPMHVDFIPLHRTRIPARSGSGPRHVAFHPNGKWMYCIHELDCTIDLYDWHVKEETPTAMLRPNSITSTLPNGTPLGQNTACEIVMSDDGRCLYACTRGTDDITVYRIDQTSGLLTEQQRVACGGKTPRYLALDPSRRWLVACNQTAPGNLAVFAHDPATGRLSETPRVFAADTPMFVLWV